MSRRLFFLVISLCVVFFASARALVLPDHLRQANVSLVVTDVASGEVVLAHAPERCATPASIVKLVTTATALELLGEDFRFVTTVAHDGVFANGVIDGNVYIVGSGDPSLGSSFVKNDYFLEAWCQQMKSLGVRKIAGNVVADASVYEREAIPPKWTWEDMGNYYGAGVFGLSVYDNTLRILMRSGEAGTQPTIVSVAPSLRGLELFNVAKSNNTEMDSVYVYGMPYDNRRWIVGAVPANRGQFLLRGDIPNPPLCVAEHFAERLKNYGIEVDGVATDAAERQRARTVLFTHESEPLSELCRITNFRSNNNYAEHIFRQLALQRGTVATNNAAVAVVTDFWKARGVDFAGVALNDGSGLSPMDAFSAEFLNKILIYMAHSQRFATFLASIPVAGKEGTVATFLKGNKSAVVHAKSGSMSGVQSYAGYIEKSGRLYSFCIIVNHFDKRKSARKAIEEWLTAVIEEL